MLRAAVARVKSVAGVLIASALLASAAVAGAPAVAGAAAPRCERKAGDTLERTTRVRVFQRVRGTVEDGQTVWLYSCRPGTRAVTRVDRWRNNLDLDRRIRGVALGGTRRLVLGLNVATGTSDSFTLLAYDLVTARRTFEFGVDGASTLPFVVTTSGAIGLLEANGLVRAFDAAGNRVFEPSGATDLAAAGARLYWTLGGLPRSTVLSGHATSS